MGFLFVTIAAGLFIAATWVDNLATLAAKLAITGFIVLVALMLYALCDDQ